MHKFYLHLNEQKVSKLGASLSDIAQSLLALSCDGSPVASSNSLLREELRTHTYAENASLNPRSKVLLCWLYGTCYHDVAPTQRCHYVLNE